MQTHPKRITNAWSTPLGPGMADSGAPRHHRTRWVGRAPPPPECADPPAADPGCAADALLASLVEAGECALLFAENLNSAMQSGFLA